MERNQARNPSRRLRSMGFVILGLAIAAAATMRSTWYTFTFSAQSVVVPGSLEQVSGVEAYAEITGSQLAGLDMGSAPMQGEIPVGPGGLLMPLLWLLLAAVLGIVTTLLRNAAPSAVGLVLVVLAHSSLGQVRAAMEGSAYGGQYVTADRGVWYFSLVTMMLAMMLLVTGVQSILINRRERAEKRSNGEEVPPTIIEIVGSLKLASLAKVASSALEEAAKNVDSKKKS